MSKKYNDAKDSYVFRLQAPEILDQLNVVLYGPPGTGKTYNTAKYAIKILDKKEVDEEKAWELLKEKLEVNEDRRVEFITFHQSYSYEEFVEGLRPKTKNSEQNSEIPRDTFKDTQVDNDDSLEYEIRPGILKSIAERATKAWEDAGSPIDGKQAPSYVLIIDEINRGDISRIFGELITIIEEDKRLGQDHEIIVTLPYSREAFGLPPNLYIIGTMNTADRSIALIDIALRRRFFFEEMMPDHTILRDKLEDCDVNLSEMLEVMNERLEYLYDRDHTLGHAYFLKVKDLKELLEVFRNKVIPLLQEYFFNDWRRIDMVLGCQAEQKSDLNKKIKKIIEEKGLKAKDLFRIIPNEFDEDKKLYQINLNEQEISRLSENKDEWIKAFKYIYEKGTVSG